VIGTTLTEEQERQAFAQKAAEAFAKDKNAATFGDVENGKLFAVRWGMLESSVLVFRIDNDYPVINYQNLIPKPKG